MKRRGKQGKIQDLDVAPNKSLSRHDDFVTHSRSTHARAIEILIFLDGDNTSPFSNRR
jgi:hypothetical protein